MHMRECANTQERKYSSTQNGQTVDYLPLNKTTFAIYGGIGVTKQKKTLNVRRWRVTCDWRLQKSADGVQQLLHFTHQVRA
jgi:hypothetical protein